MTMRLIRCQHSESTLTSRSVRFFSGYDSPPPATPPTPERRNGLSLLYQASLHAQKERVLLRGWQYDNGDREVVTYRQALDRAVRIQQDLPQSPHQDQSFIANLCCPSWEYISSMWAIWASGSASVPLALSQSTREMEHVLSDTQPQLILLGGNTRIPDHDAASSHLIQYPTHVPTNQQNLLDAAANLGMQDRILRLEDVFSSSSSHDAVSFDVMETSLGQNISLDAPALVMYTSGTTGKPKGVVSTHRNIFHQVTDLVSAWKWTHEDVALHVLPLHHVHGVINILSCAAYAGAQLDLQPFSAEALWKSWAATDRPRDSQSVSTSTTPSTTFMAVPTIYAKLLQAADQLPPLLVEEAVDRSLRPMRLMVSGSAALPVSVLQSWQSLTGHTLLERYGMTEFAMALSNPYESAQGRLPGHVGLPLPSVQVRIVDEETGDEVLEGSGKSGELQVKGDTVFAKYLNRPDATQEAFTEDGYFRTGDVAEHNAKENSYRILGRASVDILKVGGHKLSALDIERVLLEHDGIIEVVVVGVDDETWGQRIGMIYRGKSGISVEGLREWAKSRMSKHSIPSLILKVEEIPKNAMGKVNKKTLVHLFE